MALDIWIGDWNSLGSKLALSFDEEAYYWFIEPIVRQSYDIGGKFFDLYDGAEFKLEELHLVESIVACAKEQIETKPQHWKVKVGTQTNPEWRDVFVEIDKDQFLDFLATWTDIVAKCRKQQKSMFLYGD